MGNLFYQVLSRAYYEKTAAPVPVTPQMALAREYIDGVTEGDRALRRQLHPHTLNEAYPQPGGAERIALKRLMRAPLEERGPPAMRAFLDEYGSGAQGRLPNYPDPQEMRAFLSARDHRQALARLGTVPSTRGPEFYASNATPRPPLTLPGMPASGGNPFQNAAANARALLHKLRGSSR